jgi:hypothetical protein
VVSSKRGPEISLSRVARAWDDCLVTDNACGNTQRGRLHRTLVLAAWFNNDSRTIRRLCLEAIDRMAGGQDPELRSRLDDNSRRDMSIAVYLHDVGKSGPANRRRTRNERAVPDNTMRAFWDRRHGY